MSGHEQHRALLDSLSKRGQLHAVAGGAGGIDGRLTMVAANRHGLKSLLLRKDDLCVKSSLVIRVVSKDCMSRLRAN